MTREAGIMNQTIPINPWIKKFFSGVIGISRTSKMLSALIMLGIHIIMTGTSRIKRILLRRILFSSTRIREKKFILYTS